MKLDQGFVIVESKINDYIPFFIHNKKVGTTFNNGILCEFNESGIGDIITKNSFFANINIIDDSIHKVDLNTLIVSKLKGKKLSTTYNILNYNIIIENILDTASPIIATHIKITGANPFKVNYNFGANILNDKASFISNCDILINSIDQKTVCYRIDESSNNNLIDIIIIFGLNINNDDAIKLFDTINKSSEEYTDFLSNVSKGNLLYEWSLNSSLSLYKEINLTKCVFAGLDYSSPFRTYYRDSFYICLSFIKHKPDYVYNEIITLAKAITSDGKAASAVTNDYKGWWDNHIDSPLFFILLVNSYINVTNDNIIDTLIDNRTIKDIIISILDNVITDETHLIVKPAHDRKDWVDNVYREGYVSYIECLYYGALKAASKLIDNKYKEEAAFVKQSINNILWNDKLNCLYNFKSSNYLEDNISIDTIFAVIFGVVDNDRCKLMLKTFENYLESKNNPNILEDYGVMCVYPNYKYPELLTEKSSYPNRYHNGANWPYLSYMYAFCKKVFNMDYSYITQSIQKICEENNCTFPFEYYSPQYPIGSLMQGWSSILTILFDFDDFKLFN